MKGISYRIVFDAKSDKATVRVRFSNKEQGDWMEANIDTLVEQIKVLHEPLKDHNLSASSITRVGGLLFFVLTPPIKATQAEIKDLF